jgi:hypothetical protein
MEREVETNGWETTYLSVGKCSAWRRTVASMSGEGYTEQNYGKRPRYCKFKAPNTKDLNKTHHRNNKRFRIKSEKPLYNVCRAAFVAL